MTILHALASHYDRLVANDAAPSYGFSRERISYALVLSTTGDVVDVQPLHDTSGSKPRPSLRNVPQAVKRSSGVAANFLWDKTSYVFGKAKPPPWEAQAEYGISVNKLTERCRKTHDAFKKLHASALEGSDDVGLVALRRFLAKWTPDEFDRLRHNDEMLDTNVVFRLDGDQRLLHERPAARTLAASRMNGSHAGQGHCLVTGREGSISRLHPAIKGVRGAQSSGASMVSFNLDAFASFGKSQGANAPVSERAVFAYTTALNALLAPDSRRRIQIGDSTTVFWAEAADGEAAASTAEGLFRMVADPPSDKQEARRVRDVLEKVASGRPLPEVVPGVCEDTRFYILGLAPNAARISVRYWHVDSIGTLARRIGEHWSDLRLVPEPWQTPPAAWRLLYETAVRRDAKNIQPTLGGALMRAILTGSRYPRSLLAAVVIRMRADKEISGLRAAICKAVLVRDHRLDKKDEEIPVSLNRDDPNPAYRLGRLFAVYEGVQRAALKGINATIKDRYYGAASVTPASIFPILERGSAYHLATLRKDKGGLATFFDREIDSIMSGIDTSLPRSLRLEDQGRFALGYHHQRDQQFSKRNSDNSSNDTEDQEIEA